MFWQSAKAACLLILACCTGCASIPSPPQVRMPSFLNKKRASVTEEIERTSEETSEEATPKRQPLIARNKETTNANSHDPATQRLIEKELADATPQERAEWLEFLASTETSMVPYVLNSRRINKNKGLSTSPREAEADDQLLADGNQLGESGSRHSEDSSRFDQDRTEAQIKLASREEHVPESKDIAAEDANSLDWSGRFKSLTEWDRNPLNFTRDDESFNGSQRPRQLPKIIANPFQKQNADREDSERSLPGNLNFPNQEIAKAKPVTPDSLRITPGAKLWEEELNKLVSLMEAEATATGLTGTGGLSRDELRQQVALRMLYLVNDQAELAMQPIPGLEAADQEFWISLFWGLSSYLNGKGMDPAERSTATIEQLRSATHYLQMSSKLQLRNVSFCSRINGFGSYEPFAVDEFSAGQPVLIYCDIRNFQSEPSEDGFYLTKLRSSLEIYEKGNNGRLVERNPFPATEDRCRSIRSDYYHSYRIDLPQNLEPGPHILKLTVYDEFSSKSATEYLKFTIRE